MWQDYIFAIGNLVFIVALIPAVRHKEKPPAVTCLHNAVVLFIFATTYSTLHLWYAMATSFAVGCLWATLLIQQHFRQH